MLISLLYGPFRQNENCSICFDELVGTEVVAHTGNGVQHAAHRSCLTKWMVSGTGDRERCITCKQILQVDSLLSWNDKVIRDIKLIAKDALAAALGASMGIMRAMITGEGAALVRAIIPIGTGMICHEDQLSLILGAGGIGAGEGVLEAGIVGALLAGGGAIALRATIKKVVISALSGGLVAGGIGIGTEATRTTVAAMAATGTIAVAISKQGLPRSIMQNLETRLGLEEDWAQTVLQTTLGLATMTIGVGLVAGMVGRALTVDPRIRPLIAGPVAALIIKTVGEILQRRPLPPAN